MSMYVMLVASSQFILVDVNMVMAGPTRETRWHQLLRNLDGDSWELTSCYEVEPGVPMSHFSFVLHLMTLGPSLTITATLAVPLHVTQT